MTSDKSRSPAKFLLLAAMHGSLEVGPMVIHVPNSSLLMRGFKAGIPVSVFFLQ